VTDYFRHVIDVDDKEERPEDTALGDTTGYVDPVSLVLSNHNTLLPIGQEVANPIDYPGAETTLDQLDPERGMTNSVEGFGEI